MTVISQVIRPCQKFIANKMKPNSHLWLLTEANNIESYKSVRLPGFIRA